MELVAPGWRVRYKFTISAIGGPTATSTLPTRPTATPTATPTPAGCPHTNLSSLSVPGRVPQTRDDWSTPCRYYSFWVQDEGHVVIDLKGAGLDTELTLHRGRLGSLTVEGYNDDNPEASGTRDSRLGRRLSAGDYTVEARLKRASDASASKNLTLDIRGEEWIPHGGYHQADHTAAYTIARMPWVPAPLGLPQPGPMVEKAARDGIAEWNAKASGAWPDVEFCPDPCGENADGFVIDIRLGLPHECPTSVACVRLRLVAASDGVGRHIVSSPVVFEQPPAVVDSSSKVVQSFWWTDVGTKHRTLAYSGRDNVDIYWWYLYPTMLHELGHVLGLDDLKGPSRTYPGYLMNDPNDPRPMTSIPSNDVNYLHQVYRQHGGERHRP